MEHKDTGNELPIIAVSCQVPAQPIPRSSALSLQAGGVADERRVSLTPALSRKETVSEPRQLSAAAPWGSTGSGLNIRPVFSSRRRKKTDMINPPKHLNELGCFSPSVYQYGQFQPVLCLVSGSVSWEGPGMAGPRMEESQGVPGEWPGFGLMGMGWEDPVSLLPQGSALVEAHGNEGAVFLREFALIRRDDLPEESSPEDTGSNKPEDPVRPCFPNVLLLAHQLPPFLSLMSAVIYHLQK
ncbi:hypothetical protein SKAU_G00028840 [Synaphobranchus kaupii]|uniref:Uncharacterized protein n=1 Tax=Synaphobranchus kaupii TaxID=118154 RepID=A0A9Q1JCY2_SYNKA|nr:hypothetical protein SKAU_G00028840 [Synaphobranchus kaupii]